MFRVRENGWKYAKARWKNRKGQSMVEFAFIFPAFLLLVYAIIYFGYVFADYSTLNNIARSAARAASLQGEAKYDTIVSSELAKLKATNGMPSMTLSGDPLFLFTKQDGALFSDATFNVKADDSKDNVIVTIVAPMNKNAAIGKLLNAFDYGKEQRWPKLTVTYTMYNEAKGTSSGS